MKTYEVLGLMTGSSMDGLDMAYCRFREEAGHTWKYELLQTTCVDYPSKWISRLQGLPMQNAVNYLKTSAYFGVYLGQVVRDFLSEHHLKPDFVALHGHTVFHQPEHHVSSQVGDGSAVAAICGLPVIAELRSADVALGGQGAPIVPVGDKMLFPSYAFCLNLGGIGNISCKQEDDTMTGFDVCPVNVVLNDLARQLGKPFDKDGELGREGKVDNSLLEQLNKLWYYDKDFPKTLSLGWVKKVFDPALGKSRIPTHEKLRTVYEHIAVQIGEAVKLLKDKGVDNNTEEKMMITGGGAMNSLLVERIAEHVPVPVEVPDEGLVKYKEALVMAFLGVLRMQHNPNCLATVTGASQDSVNGALYPGQARIGADEA